MNRIRNLFWAEIHDMWMGTWEIGMTRQRKRKRGIAITLWNHEQIIHYYVFDSASQLTRLIRRDEVDIWVVFCIFIYYVTSGFENVLMMMMTMHCRSLQLFTSWSKIFRLVGRMQADFITLIRLFLVPLAKSWYLPRFITVTNHPSANLRSIDRCFREITSHVRLISATPSRPSDPCREKLENGMCWASDKCPGSTYARTSSREFDRPNPWHMEDAGPDIVTRLTLPRLVWARGYMRTTGCSRRPASESRCTIGYAPPVSSPFFRRPGRFFPGRRRSAHR